MSNISKSVFEMQLSVMKGVLKLGEFKFGGKDSDQFKFFKESVMNTTYEELKKFYQKLAKEGVFEPCNCGASIRHGWNSCPACSGSGWKDAGVNKLSAYGVPKE